MFRLRRAARAAALALCLPAAAHASDFIDTRLSFVFADDNVLAREGETTPSSPNARIGASSANNQFYDNFNTRFSGFETLSNLTLYKQAAGFFDGLTTEAALTILFLERPNGGVLLQDNSSYIKLNYRPAGWGEKEGFSFTGFPVSADRFRLGYAYRISWGGSGVFTNRAFQDGVPGGKLQVNKQIDADRGWYAFLGGKTALLYNDLSLEKQTLYGVMGGGGVDLHKYLRLDVDGGYFQKGLVPGLASQGIEAPINLVGTSAQLVFHKGAPVGTSIDFRLYKNDPDVYTRFFTPETYSPGAPAAITVSLEGSHLVQTLEDPDAFARTTPQTADALALQGRVKWNYLRAHILGLYRSLSFLRADSPGFPPNQDFPSGSELSPEMFIAGGADYHFPRAHFTPGVVLGVQRPASYKPPVAQFGGNNPPPGLEAPRTVVFRDVDVYNTLPVGTEPELIFSAKATFRWDLSEYVAAIGEIYYTRDTNRASFRDDVSGIAEPTFEKPHALGFNTMLQARF